MNPCDLIRRASLAGIALNVRGGQLYAALPADPPAALVATVKAHKPAVVACLETLTACPAFLAGYQAKARDVAIPDPLRSDAEALAGDLAETGGLGQFIVNLFHTWNDLDPTDRAAACLAWQLALALDDLELAA